MSGPWEAYAKGPWSDYEEVAAEPPAVPGRREVPTRSSGEAVADVGLSLGQGAVGAFKALSDIAGADNVVSRGLGTASEFLGSKKSEQSKAISAASAQRIREAEASDEAGSEVKAYLDALWDQPAEMLAQAAGSFATLGIGKAAQAFKLMSAAKAAGASKAAFLASDAGKAAAKVAAEVGFRTNIGVGAGMGLGAVKGSQYEQTYRNALQKGMSEEQARALAEEAQAYGGAGTGQQLLGAGLGALASATGPIERVIAGAPVQGAVTSLPGAIAKGALAEAVPEATQGAQERYAGNVAAIDAGVLSPEARFRGVVGQAAQEGLLAGIIGGAAGPLEQERAPIPESEAGLQEQEAQRQREEARFAARQERAEEPQLPNVRDRTYADLLQQEKRLEQEPQTALAKEKLRQIKAARAQMDVDLVETSRQQKADAEREAQMASESAFAATEPQQVEIGGLGEPGKLPVVPEPEAAEPTRAELEAAGQRRLPLRATRSQYTTPPGQAVPEQPTPSAPALDEDTPEPTLRKGPEPEHPALTKEAIGGRALNWANGPKGREFVQTITAMSPNQVQDLREEYAKNPDKDKNRQAVFNAIYPETPTGSDVRPESAVVEPAAEPSVGVPVPSGPAGADTAGAEPLDGAGVAPSEPVAAAEPAPEGSPAPAVAPPARPNAFTIPKRSLLNPQREAEEARQEAGGVFYKGDAYRTVDPQAAPTASIPDAELRKIVDSVTKSLDLPDGAGIVILDSVRQLDPSQRPGSRAGAVVGTQAYLFRDGIPNGVEGQKTVFHEVLHKGLRQLYTTDQFVRELTKLYNSDATVKAMADKWVAKPENKADLDAVTKDPAMQLALSVDEALADMAEQRKPPATLRRIGNWLAKVADTIGMKQLAKRIRTMGMTELEAFVDTALRAAGGSAKSRGTGPVYRTPKDAAERAEKITSALKDETQNPRHGVRSKADSDASFMERFGNLVWSTDTILNGKIQRAIEAAGLPASQAIDLQMRIATHQTSHAGHVADMVMQDGAGRYDAKNYAFKTIKSQYNTPALIAAIQKVADKYGITPAKAEEHFHYASEAARLKEWAELNQQAEIAAQAFEANGDKASAAKARKRKKAMHRTPEQIQIGLELFEQMPELREATRIWDGFRGNVLDLMVESGVVSSEQAQSWFDNAAYVPFYREGQLEAGAGAKDYVSGLMVRPEVAAKGSVDRPVADIVDNMLRWSHYAIERSVRNHKAGQMIDALLENGMAEQIKAPGGKKPKGLEGNIARIYRNGEVEFYDVKTPGVLEAFQGVESVATPMLNVFTKIANLLRQNIVLNPIFSTLQAPQDAFAAMFTSGLKPQYALTIPARAVKEFANTLRGMSKTHEELRRYAVTGQRDMTAAIHRNNLEAAAGFRKGPVWVRKAANLLHNISMASDNAVRQAVYEAAQAQGVPKGEAIKKATDIINFRYRGRSGKIAALAQVVPFLNAYLAATNAAYKTVTGAGISPTTRSAALQTLASTVAVTMALSALYAMLVSDDEDYQKMAPLKRDRALLIPGLGVNIPLRSDLFLLPKIAGEYLWNTLADNGTSDGPQFKAAVAEAITNSIFAPTAVPQAAKPALEVLTNYNFFTKRALVGPYEARIDKALQYNDSTSELAKALGPFTGVLGVSPIALDHMIRGYLGTTGGLALYLTNQLLGGVGEVERANLTFRDAVAAFPGMGSVVNKDNETGLEAAFYELRDATRKAKLTLDSLEQKRPQDMEEYVSRPKIAPRLELAESVDDVSRELADLRRYAREINALPASEMSASEKREALAELEGYKTQLLESLPLREWREQAKL